ncbi:MAG: hypothetical protein MOP49_588 [Nitrososphaera sp.]|nr:hypothetical protein [Nitrososphaera sp.]
MSQLNTVMAIFAVVAAAGIIGTVGVFLATAQSVDAWHSLFGSKKLCTDYMKTVNGNTTAEAQFMCQKVIPH